jgi:hypothetical protein
MEVSDIAQRSSLREILPSAFQRNSAVGEVAWNILKLLGISSEMMHNSFSIGEPSLMAAALVLPSVAGYAFDSSPDLSDIQARERLSPSAVKGFLQIMDRWGIKDPDARQLLGGISSGSYYGWKKQTKREPNRILDQDKLIRISLLIGIFKALNILYSETLADAWITLPNRNPMFRGASPLAYMIERGQPGMLHLRQLLDARRGG